MKKIRFAAAMVLIISVLLLPACGGTPKTDDGTNSSTSSGEVDGAGKDLADDAKDVGDDMKDAADGMADGAEDMVLQTARKMSAKVWLTASRKRPTA